MSHMRRGEWDAAWRISDLELRRRFCSTLRRASCPRHLQAIWDGTPLEGRRVLIHCYHGMGDTVQFIRFVGMVRRIAARTIVVAQPNLIPLLKTAAGVDELLPLDDGEPDVDRDVDIEMMELPHALRTTLDTLPAEVPYFNIRPAERQPGGAPTVGLVWQSGEWDPRRSVPPCTLAKLLGTGGIEWRVLQRGPALAARPPGMGKVPDIHNILDEAAELRALDLLISVDTLSAHLGGALAVPTWTLLPLEADWRWMDNRADSPWYPTMRLFRQRAAGDWESLIERVATELRHWRQCR